MAKRFEDYFWLGATEKEEGVWLWESNQVEVNLRSFWKPEKPTLSKTLHCLGMGPGGMYDGNCASSSYSVCGYNSTI